MSNAQVKYIYQHKMECSISLFTYRSSFLNKKRFKVANKKLTAAWKKGKEFYTYICFYLLIEAISGYFCAQTYCVCKTTKNREEKFCIGATNMCEVSGNLTPSCTRQSLENCPCFAVGRTLLSHVHQATQASSFLGHYPL